MYLDEEDIALFRVASPILISVRRASDQGSERGENEQDEIITKLPHLLLISPILRDTISRNRGRFGEELVLALGMLRHIEMYRCNQEVEPYCFPVCRIFL